MDFNLAKKLQQPPADQHPVMHNRWTDLLFLHWSFAPESVQALLPPGLTVDAFGDRAWIGVVPFGMERIRPVWLPPIPGLSWFLEMNLRTYVTCDKTGEPGVWFFSLDASQRLACAVARRFFHLPYHFAKMRRRYDADGWIHYTSRKDAEPPCEFVYRAGQGSLTGAVAESFEFFLVERYLLFAWDNKHRRLSSGRVHHTPYQIAPAIVAEARCQALFLRAGLTPPARPPESALFSPLVRTLIYPLREMV
ncbi:MAG: DUF2071 domain-containing protein [Verrucomicrobiales bacterium]|nr:DUF2071 domain-containing protein [Verrucomicrobiales bacterium]